MSDRRQHYFRCPACQARLRVAPIKHPQAATDWSDVDWDLPTKRIAMKLGVREETVSKRRAALAPHTLRAPRTKREGA